MSASKELPHSICLIIPSGLERKKNFLGYIFGVLSQGGLQRYTFPVFNSILTYRMKYGFFKNIFHP